MAAAATDAGVAPTPQAAGSSAPQAPKAPSAARTKSVAKALLEAFLHAAPGTEQAEKKVTGTSRLVVSEKAPEAGSTDDGNLVVTYKNLVAADWMVAPRVLWNVPRDMFDTESKRFWEKWAKTCLINVRIEKRESALLETLGAAVNSNADVGVAIGWGADTDAHARCVRRFAEITATLAAATLVIPPPPRPDPEAPSSAGRQPDPPTPRTPEQPKKKLKSTPAERACVNRAEFHITVELLNKDCSPLFKGADGEEKKKQFRSKLTEAYEMLVPEIPQKPESALPSGAMALLNFLGKQGGGAIKANIARVLTKQEAFLQEENAARTN